MSDARFARQILVFGEAGQRKLQSAYVGIVGLGGLGAQVAQGLGYLGVGRFLLVDDDNIDETNLNRTPGAFPADVGRPKVEVARDMIRRLNEHAKVVTISKNLRARPAMEALISCPTIFGCVDHDGPRLVLNDLAAAYEITLIDLATEIFPETASKPLDFGGRVVVARPGDFCLFCANQIDPESAKQDLETPDIREVRRRHGYGLGDGGPAPAVFPLNGIIANLGMAEFLAMTTGIREPARLLRYLGLRGAVRDTTDHGKANCFTCNCLRGQRGNANIWRYLQPH